MNKNKIGSVAAGIVCFVFVCVIAVYGRISAERLFENQNIQNARELIGRYEASIQYQMRYKLNRAREIALKMESDPEDVKGFEQFAETVLQKQKEPARVALADETTMLSILPVGDRSYVGKPLKELPYVFNSARMTGDTVVNGPGDFFGDGWLSFQFFHPIFTENGYWGEVLVCLDAQEVFSVLELDALSEQGYEYELWSVDAQDGKKVVISASDSSFDFSDGVRVSFSMPAQWTLTVMPRVGWVGVEERRMLESIAAIVVLLAFGMCLSAVFLMLQRNERKLLQYEDKESGFLNHRGFERALKRVIHENAGPFGMLYFVVDRYNQVSQISSAKERQAYLSQVKRGMKEGIRSHHIIGRLGEGNFIVCIMDDLSELALTDLARYLAMELIWKTKRGERKEFLNVGYQFVRYPQDGTEAGPLIEKVVGKYYERTIGESPVISLTKKCRRLILGEDVEFEEYSDAEMMSLSQTLNQYRKQVEQLAYQDAVFHVGTRSKYLRDAHMFISYNKKRPFTLFCIDICGFSRYNELFSVETGDRILHEVCQRLRRVFGDDLYRINGDVFLGIAQGSDMTEEMQPKIFDALAEPMFIGTLKLTLEANYGVCAYPQHSKTPEDLLECVQTALHYAKRNSEKVVVYDEALTKVLRRELVILECLKNGLEDSSLEVWFQPIVDLQSKCIMGAEALIRLRGADGAYISAAQVIEIAEKNRIVSRVGKYVLKKVIRLLCDWGDSMTLERVGLNLSVQELLLEDCVDTILAEIRESGAEPSKISLEVTETVLIESFEKIRPVLEKLREAGFHIVLDDFGVGYSSLNYFSNLPVDALKIDRSLTSRVVESEKQVVLLKTIVEMARINEIRVIAEGVETEEEQAQIERIGVRYIQGYYYSRPLPEATFLELMKQNAKI